MPIQVGAVTFSDHEVSEFREVFELVDVDKGGTIEADEVMDLMEMLGIETSREQVLNLISDIDKDGNGDIDFDEFLQVMAAGQSLPYSKQLMIKNFSTFRKTKPEAPPGMIHVKDLRTALATSSYRLNEKEIQTLIKTMQPNEQGLVNFMEKINLHLQDDPV